MPYLVDVLKGALIGIANTIPGVSGGTIAVITGIYEKLIAIISGFFKEKRWKSDFRFLACLGIGLGIGIVLSSRVLSYFLKYYPVQTAFFFAGLILGSLPFLVKIVRKTAFRAVYLVPLLAAFALMVWQALTPKAAEAAAITTLSPAVAPGLLLAGILAAAAMVVPGISGSFLLILIGYYATFIEAAKGLNLPILAVAGTGAAIGIIVISRGINFLLAKFHAPTYYAIIGLVAGSVLAVIANAYAPKDPSLVQAFSVPVEIALNAGAFVAGLVPALLLGADRKGKNA